ncbi:hypothetical protein [Mesorhizobium sp. M00.F.Ca.ET.216.01.1.1]|uniref:hypothetical protein n=1 Tax=Mesorhizobium sp. M00.F.Ca.ET.216.01.1.1 TaxID=2500528 RepID=UPI000FDC9773|nr:hypothetical protein [Mesorhizobium sp. M00.F.Ca.ET.216.01.1.1]TGQ29407.1 hypothetical protein EN859_033250 [Mesorhizobium sp. M00.F.Ca.ET.216.01.1.1]
MRRANPSRVRCVELNFLCLIIISTVLAACSSSEDLINKQSRSAVSAAETASLTLDAWLAGTVPLNYTSGTLQSVAQKLSDAEAQIQSTDSSVTPDQTRLAISRLAAAVASAETGLKDGKPAKVEQAQLDLRNAIAALVASKSFSPDQ